MNGAAPGDADASAREQRIEALFGEYLAAVDRGEDREEELLARAAELAPELLARMQLERELRALAPDKATASGPEAPPQRIGRFRILGLLGKGGISVVYLAHDPDMGRRVALKVLNSDSLLDKQNRAWMLNEARALAQLAHPSVVKVHEVGETGTHTYLAMELVTGPSLREVIDELARNARGEPPSPKGEVVALAERLRPFSARVAVLRQLADALATCHDRGVLHRDIKPHNVLFDAQGTPRLIDFGLAHDARADEDSRIGLTQNLVGTAAYLAPEQVSGNETGADPRSDQFSFGIVAYECFALKNPFQRETQRATMAAAEEAEPPPLRSLAAAIPADLALVIQRALARDPALRHASMAVLGRDLEAVLQHRPVSVQEPSLAHVARLWLRRHRRRVRVAAAALALFVGTLALGTLTDTLRQRGRLRESLATIEPDGFGSVQPFHDSAPLLAELEREAARIDARAWSRFVPTSRAHVTASIEAWSRNLDRLWQADVRASLERGTPLQDGTYRQLFWQEELLCPECPYNQENRLRGRVLLPEAPGYERALDILCQETLEERGGVGDFTSVLPACSPGGIAHRRHLPAPAVGTRLPAAGGRARLPRGPRLEPRPARSAPAPACVAPGALRPGGRVTSGASRAARACGSRPSSCWTTWSRPTSSPSSWRRRAGSSNARGMWACRKIRRTFSTTPPWPSPSGPVDACSRARRS